MSGMRHQAKAWVDLLNTHLGTVARAYEAGEVPATPPSHYVVVSVERRDGGTERADGRTGSRMYRMETLYKGHRRGELLWLADRVSRIEGASVLGSTPLTFEAPGIEPRQRDGAWESSEDWIYATANTVDLPQDVD